MTINIRKKPAALVPTPDGMYVQLFVDEDGLPKTKDSDGNVVSLSQSNTMILVEQGVAPSAEANKTKLYGFDVAGITELFVRDSSGNQIQITDNGAIAGGGGTSLTPTTIQSGAIIAAAGDLVIIDAAVPGTVTLPTAPVNGAQVGLKILGAALNSIVVSGGGGDSVEFGAGLTLAVTREWAVLSYDANNATWFQVG